jgi:hypothetical protein
VDFVLAHVADKLLQAYQLDDLLEERRLCEIGAVIATPSPPPAELDSPIAAAGG